MPINETPTADGGEEQNESAGRSSLTKDDVFEILEESFPEPRTITEIGKELDYSKGYIHMMIHDLEDEGRVHSKKIGGNSVVWWIVPEDFESFDERESEERPEDITFEDVREVMENSDEKLTIEEVAEQLGTTVEAITASDNPKYSDQDILDTFKAAAPEPLMRHEIADALGCHLNTVKNRLPELVENGEIKTKKPTYRSQIYWIDVDRTGDN